jgi:hypothetical protein
MRSNRCQVFSASSTASIFASRVQLVATPLLEFLGELLFTLVAQDATASA